MTRYEIAKQISERMNNSLNRTAIEIVLLHLNEMGLIEFESERDVIIREANEYLKSGQGYRLEDVGKYHSLIESLVSLIK